MIGALVVVADDPVYDPTGCVSVDRMSRSEGEVLYYRISDYGNSVVFAREPDALRVDTINRAINTAETWGQFRAMLPDGEWDSIADAMDPDEIDLYGDDRPFDTMLLPGFRDRTYPTWLMPRMLHFLPGDIVELSEAIEVIEQYGRPGDAADAERVAAYR